MAQNRHWRNGVHRRRWTCPNHKHGVRKTVVGKPCPTCGATSESIANGQRYEKPEPIYTMSPSPEKISGDGVFLQAETKTHPGRIYESPGVSVVEKDISVVEPK